MNAGGLEALSTLVAVSRVRRGEDAGKELVMLLDSPQFGDLRFLGLRQAESMSWYGVAQCVVPRCTHKP